jgi:hypothetical protein
LYHLIQFFHSVFSAFAVLPLMIGLEWDFAKSGTVDKIDDVPVDFRPLYKESTEEKDGVKKTTFKLDTDSPQVKSSVAAITGLNAALRAARAEAKTNKPVDLSPLKDLGGTPEEIKAAVDKRIAELETQLKGTNVDQIKKDLETPWKMKLTTAETERDALKKHLNEELVESRSVSAIAAEKGNITLLRPILSKYIKTTVENGRYVVHVVNDDGEQRYNGDGTPMKIADKVKEMKSDPTFAPCFASEAPSGGGASPTAASSSTSTVRQFATQQANNRDANSKIAEGIRKQQYERRA